MAPSALLNDTELPDGILDGTGRSIPVMRAGNSRKYDKLTSALAYAIVDAIGIPNTPQEIHKEATSGKKFHWRVGEQNYRCSTMFGYPLIDSEMIVATTEATCQNKSFDLCTMHPKGGWDAEERYEFSRCPISNQDLM